MLRSKLSHAIQLSMIALSHLCISRLAETKYTNSDTRCQGRFPEAIPRVPLLGRPLSPEALPPKARTL